VTDAITPPQTVGPFFHDSLLQIPRNVISEPTEEDRIAITGRVLDGGGSPVDDALIEIWHSDRSGRFMHENFLGFGRAATDDFGTYWLETVRPGAPGGGAPCIWVHVFARGLLDRLATRIYLADESSNGEDPLLNSVPEERRPTLIASRSENDGLGTYHFDIRLQGDGETVFFDI
jgi:protocatechuate 3,4-dioxygenase alpha subunit